MATTIKVKTVLMPNLITGSDVSILEKAIESEIEKKISNGYSLIQVVGGDAYVLLIFSKTT